MASGLNFEPIEPEKTHYGAIEELEVCDLLQWDCGFGFVEKPFFDVQSPLSQGARHVGQVSIDEEVGDDEIEDGNRYRHDEARE